MVLIFLCLWLASCGQIPFDNVSSNPEYSSVIGKQFSTKEELWAIGVMSNIDYPKKVDYIVLVHGVGFSGREVVTRDKLNRGYIFRVVRVLKARSFLSSEINYVVEEFGSNKFKGYEVRILLIGDIHNRNYGLDESIYSLETNSH